MFKNTIVFAVLCSVALAAQARVFQVGECVTMPTVYVEKAKRLVPDAVVVYPGAFSEWHAWVLQTNEPFYIRDIEKTRAYLAIAPGVEGNPNAGRGIGWVEFKDLRVLPDVNCR